MGEFDLVPDILEETGVKLLFRTIAVKPGKPTIFGKKGNKMVFGLPGNPVSSFFQFELLVKPLIYKVMNHKFEPSKIRLPMAVDYVRDKSFRKSWIPVQITEKGELLPIEYHGSAHIYALDKAEGLISLPVGKNMLSKGELVDVRQI